MYITAMLFFFSTRKMASTSLSKHINTKVQIVAVQSQPTKETEKIKYRDIATLTPRNFGGNISS